MLSYSSNSRHLMRLIFCLISPVRVLVEEIIMAVKTFRITNATGNLLDNYVQSTPKNENKNTEYNWDKLTEEEQSKMVEFYNFKAVVQILANLPNIAMARQFK